MSKYSNINWEEMIQEQKESGLTISQFCKSKEINEKAFYNYKKKFKNENGLFKSVVIEKPETIRIRINGIVFEFDKKYLSTIMGSLVS